MGISQAPSPALTTEQRRVAAERPLPHELAPVPRVALTREEAAAAVGMSIDSFEQYVQPHLRIIRLGRLRLVSVTELESWAKDAAAATL